MPNTMDHVGSATALSAGPIYQAPLEAVSIRDADTGECVCELAIGQDLNGFILLRRLGEGSFGTVCLALDSSLQRHVALKITAHASLEARTLAKLDHDNIVQVYHEQPDTERDLRLLCMQYVAGASLDKVMRFLRERHAEGWSGQTILEAVESGSPYPEALHPGALRDRERLARGDALQAVLHLGAQLAEALDHAHQQGVLHRDIKPANILINSWGRPFLADFNLSAHTPSAADAPFGGTLAYMAPEHLDAFNGLRARTSVDERSDIYALGQVLFELLMGHPIFPAASRNASSTVAAAVTRRYLPDLRLPDLVAPAVLPHLYRRCLDSDPGHRCATAGELARSLHGAGELRRIEHDLPRSGALTQMLLRFPFFGLAALSVAPHVVATLVNIAYNWFFIVRHLDADQESAFAGCILIYNSMVYPVCVGVLLAFVWPGWQSWQRLRRGDAVECARVDAARRRLLKAPALVVVLSCAGWLAGGLFFPLAISLWTASVSPEVFGHFLVSFTLSGLIALTYCHFGASFVVLRVLYPRFWIDAQDVRRRIDDELRDGRSWSWLFQVPAITIPLVGAATIVHVGPDMLVDQAFRILVIALIVFGMIGFGIALHVNRLISRTLAALLSEPRP